MKEKYFLNARIIDPSQNIDEIGGLIVGSDGKIKSVGKNVKKDNSNRGLCDPTSKLLDLYTLSRYKGSF